MHDLFETVMEIPKNIFQPVSLLPKSAPMFVKHGVHSGKQWTIRAVWIIGDLETLHEWRAAPSKKTNWNINTETASLLRYYKNILISDNAQSVIVEQSKLPVVQFDILTFPQTGWPDDILFREKNYCINFLFKDNFRDPDLFSACLRCLVECISTFSEIQCLFIKLIHPDPYLDRHFKSVGFEWLNPPKFLRKPPPIYRLQINTYRPLEETPQE